MEHTKRNGRGFFAAANTDGGFRSYFDSIFGAESLDRLTVLKGGSGTGKSSFLKKLGRAAEDAGYSVEYFYCSSDPSSLDGILYRRGNIERGAVDGTAPHTRDAELVGVRDGLYNLADYLDIGLLIPRRQEIAALQKRKKELYAAAYCLLSAAGNAEKCRRELSLPYLSYGKMSDAAGRILKEIKGGDGRVLLRPTDSVGVKGRVRLDTLGVGAERVYRVVGQDAAEFLGCLADSAKAGKLGMTFSPLLLGQGYSALLLGGGAGIAFTAEEKGCSAAEGEKTVNMERFIRITDSADRKTVRQAVKMRESNLSAAAEILAKAGKIHGEIEKIYISAMDYEAKDEREERIIDELI